MTTSVIVVSGSILALIAREPGLGLLLVLAILCTRTFTNITRRQL